jgi:acetolactate synthase-1/2/3 large subunit
MTLIGSEILAKALKRHDVECFFYLMGGPMMAAETATMAEGIRGIDVRHEQAAAHAAEAYARLSGRVGVCVATSGPGATNLMTGLTAAKMDSTPIVAITGQVARPFMGTEAFQECDTCGMAAPVVKKTYLVMSPEDIAPTIREAFRVAQEGRPGPVLVDLPKDVQAESFLFEELEDAWHPSPPAVADAESVNAAARLINESERPLLIAGRGVHVSGAWEELQAVAEHINAPVLNTLHGTSAFPRHHDLGYGMLGMHGMYWSNIATTEADLIVGVGMRFDDRVIGRPGTFGENAKIIHLDIEPSQFHKNVRTEVALAGDVKASLDALMPLLDRHTHFDWLDRMRYLEHKHPSIDVPESDVVTPQYVLRELNKLVEHDTDPVVITGVGQHQMWAAQFLFMPTPNSFVSSGGLGVMGFEVPAMIGAQVARPNSRVWGICGDGGFQMTMMELATAVENRLPVKYAILNNNHLGMITQWQELFYMGDTQADAYTANPDFVKLAEAFGMKGMRIEEIDDVEDAIEEANAHPGPVIVDFVIEKVEHVYPMIPAGGSIKDLMEDTRV